jgi:multisubunit Na+/H+ antiporter MnhB subunit
MAQATQTYANHTRWHPPFHFVLFPILLLHFLYSAYRLYAAPDFAHAEALLLSVGLLLMMLLVRINPLRAQDRLIRLEEQWRYQRLLPADLAARAAEMPVRFIVALRFASDAELPGLVQQVLDRKFAKPAEVKRAIKNWRGDYFRV